MMVKMSRRGVRRVNRFEGGDSFDSVALGRRVRGDGVGRGGVRAEM